MSEVVKFKTILNGIDDTTQKDVVRFGDLVATFEKRGFGALLMVPLVRVTFALARMMGSLLSWV
ncbi:exopolysaccharide biosynthesis protein [Catenovulum sediminis]|uniref:Uncharacterized protein n=1 Tax=Catenovulum sediminis TaxID=1740262 RepID=A0ABV1RL52_9ALTE|nr:exopolysaccharide biosynthesis protein [Catenovulum sediminis]